MKQKVFIKTATLFLMLLALTTFVKAQTVTFGYDPSGNRISRRVLAFKSAEVKPTKPDTVITAPDIQPQPTHQPTTVATNYNDAVGDYQFTIYPNPTHGLLRVQFNSIEGMKTGQITVYNTGGAQIKNLPVTNTVNDIDLLNQPAGVYFMAVQMNGRSITWKIIKQ